MTQTPRDRYQAWLGDAAAGAEVVAGPKLGASPYELFQLEGPPGADRRPAAATASALVAAKDPSGWGPFLTSAEPSVVHAQIGWLQGGWVAHSPTAKVSAKVLQDPKNAKYVAAPEVETAEGKVTFEGYYGLPPSMEPFRYRVVVDAAGQATFTSEPVWKLP